MKRALAPSLNSTGLGSAAAAIYAAVVMVWNATHNQGVIDPQVIVAALSAAAFLYARFKVTPISDPKDGNGQPLLKLPLAPITLNTASGLSAAQVEQVKSDFLKAVRTENPKVLHDVPPPSVTRLEAPPVAPPPASTP